MMDAPEQPEAHYLDDPLVDIAEDGADDGNSVVWALAPLVAILIICIYLAGKWLETKPPQIVFQSPAALPPPPALIQFLEEGAITVTDKGWHEGAGWKFENLLIDGASKTVSGNCSAGETK